jgi:hypothetical protein
MTAGSAPRRMRWIPRQSRSETAFLAENAGVSAACGVPSVHLRVPSSPTRGSGTSSRGYIMPPRPAPEREDVMPPCEPRAAVDRRLLWMSAFAVALWLFLVNPSTALAGGDHPSSGWDSSDHGSGGWQNDTEGSPPSWGHDHGQPPSEGSGPGQPCENQGPPEEQPPVETPPAETPPVETPPVETPPVETPPVETPPETPTTPPETPSTREQHGGGGVMSKEQGQGGGGVVTAAPAETAETTLPFTGSDTPLLMLVGVAFLGLGLVLHRVNAERG